MKSDKKVMGDKWQVMSKGKTRHSSLVTRHSENGIALIITLILLSVTLIMAVAFLAISNRERGSVTTESDTTTARLAADAALAHAEAQIMANVLSTTNPYNFGLIVSTNYINPNGFDPANGNPFENVNYDHLLGNSTPLSQNQFLTVLTNLWYLPRAPVFIPTNGAPASYDFRFYLDLNRNGRFDTNGFVADMDNLGNTNGNFTFQVGDPEWIGGLERPDVPHGPNNHFLYRYAFIAVPIGNALDLNYIHNQVFDEPASASPGITIPVNPATPDRFFRNQGVGSWEINLAAFLTDLNTNQWDPPTALNSQNDPYVYQEPAFANTGRGFEDARALLSYRYAKNYNSLASVQNLFGNVGATAFKNDDIDGYSDGPLQTTFDTNADFFVNNDNPALPWAGADNMNHFFDLSSDLFDTNKSPVAFVKSLTNSGAANSSYDRYTFYRLLSQLGTDSSAESGKININYDNIDPGSNGVLNVSGTASVTNFVPWTALGFFTNAADRMLRTYTSFWLNENYQVFTNTFGASVTNAFGITNIPVYVNGQFAYTPAVNRVLQLAANIYDATTNKTALLGNNYPSVFKPFFSRDTFGNVFISGYEQIPFVTGTGDTALVLPVDVTDPSVGVVPNVNVYGVPWIIGAKKGFPNFNEFSMASLVDLTRRLQITRPTITSPISSFHTNQMYIMGISNYLGVECWNSYVASYTNQIDILVRSSTSLTLTNDAGMTPRVVNATYSMLLSTNPWPGSVWQSGGRFYPYAGSFQIPLYTNFILIPDLVYRYNDTPPDFVSTNGLNPLFETTTSFPLPQFGLLMTNRLQVIMIDHVTGQIIDYVSFNGPDTSRNLNSEFADPDDTGNLYYVWSTNYFPNTTLPYGVNSQILISQGLATLNTTQDGKWQSDPEATGTPPYQQAFFAAFFSANNIATAVGWGNYTTPQTVTATNLQLSVQAPYTPTRYALQSISWQANDPLVHYIAADLNYTTNAPSHFNYGYVFTNFLPNIGQLNSHYEPWGGYPLQHPANVTPDYNMALKDPLVWRSDDWDFPTNKFPTVGWLGRVHRGTPWQTVFLKSTNILANNNIAAWQAWTGNGNPFDATNTAPVQDRLLFDIFTTAFNDNATRGQLSINVGAGSSDPMAGLGAWSAVFSGVIVLSNNATAGAVNGRQLRVPEPPLSTTNFTINPAGVNGTNSVLGLLVQSIYNTRTNTNLFPLQSFQHVGDILAVPQLTQQSPFLNLPVTNGINDEMYEWLPQQTMSLLRVSGSPRYVIYSYGQALRPAPNGITTSSSFFGMVTNYQVVAEMNTRAVVRFNSTLTNNLGTNSVINNSAVIESFNILPPD